MHRAVRIASFQKRMIRKKKTPVNVLVDITKLFVFSDFSEITRLAQHAAGLLSGE